MCEPTTMFLVGSGLALYQGAQQVQQGKYERALGEYRQDIHEYRARVAENDAEQVRAAGLDKETQQRQKAAQILSQQRAQLAASGVDISTGSAADIQADTEVLGEADALRIRSNTELQAQVFEDQAGFETAMGEFELAAGKARQKDMNRKAFGTVLTGIGTSFVSSGVAAKWFTPSSAAFQGGSLAPAASPSATPGLLF